MLQNKKKIKLARPEREAMRHACQFNASLLDYLRDFIKPGITTGEIDELVYDYTTKHGHVPAPLGYPGEHGPFPKSCCTSVNDVICHGIPDGYALQSGDIVNVDVTSIVDGWHGDSSETFLIGEISDIARAVTQCSFDCLWLAIDAITPG
jgi:methionyl aminopeptidase